MKRNYAIDSLRIIAVCLVVYIHIFELNKGFVYSDSMSWKLADVFFGLSRLAVPVFFAISGWYIFSKNRDEQITKLKKQIPKLINILLVATVGTAIALWALTNLHSTTLTFLPDVRGLFEIFMLGKSTGIAPLWFLVSLIIVEALYLGAAKYISPSKRDGWLLFPALVFFLGLLTFTSYRSVFGFSEPTFSINETWFVAFTWFTLGYFLAKFFKDNPGRITTAQLRLYAIIAGMLYAYEYILHTSGAPFVFGPYNYNAIFLFTPFVVAGVLLLAARNTHDGRVIRTLAHLGKNYALGVFIIHIVVMQPINKIFTKFDLLSSAPTLKLVVTYSSAVLLSLGLTILYYKAKPLVLGYIKTMFHKAA